MNSFSIDTMAKEDGPPVTGGPALHDAACKTLDYVQIESKSSSNDKNQFKFNLITLCRNH